MVTYDPVTRDWAELVTAGQVPAPTAGAASAVSSEGTLYVYGGVARGDRHGFWLVDTSSLLYSLGPQRAHTTSPHYPLSRCGEARVAAAEPQRGLAAARGEGSGLGARRPHLPVRRLLPGRRQARLQPPALPGHPGPPHRGGLDQRSGGVQPEVAPSNSSLVSLNMFALSRRNCYQYPSTRGCPPSPRCGSAACVVGHRVFLFGGRCKQRRLNDLHCLDLGSLAWTLLDPGTDPDPFAPPSASRPAPRSLHTMAYIGANRWADTYTIYMFV